MIKENVGVKLNDFCFKNGTCFYQGKTIGEFFFIFTFPHTLSFKKKKLCLQTLYIVVLVLR